ncbi:hypothetical protein C7S15_7197 [Burkholderia cepacia]|nr:hypothetical protein [Burkholderia cepacia]
MPVPRPPANRGGGCTGAAHVGAGCGSRGGVRRCAAGRVPPGYAFRQEMDTFISTILEIWK